MFVIVSIIPKTNADIHKPLVFSQFSFDVVGPFKSKVEAQKHIDKWPGMKAGSYIERVYVR